MEKFIDIYENIATLHDRVVELQAEVKRLENFSITRFMNNPMIPDKDKERVVDLYFSSWCPSTRCEECLLDECASCMNREYVKAFLYGKELTIDRDKEAKAQTNSEE